MVGSLIVGLDMNRNSVIDYREFLAANLRKKLFNSPDEEENNF